MKLSFGNMTLELNIFNVCKQPGEVDDDLHEVNMIQSIIHDNLNGSFCSNPLEACFLEYSSSLDIGEENSEFNELTFVLNSSQVIEASAY